MNRLLNFNHSLSPIQYLQFKQIKSLSTIQPTQFLKNVFGPNYPKRIQALKRISSHPQSFQHFHLKKVTHDYIRQKSAQLIFLAHKLNYITYEDYLKDPNQVSILSSAYVNYSFGFSIKAGVHLFLYMKTIHNLGTQLHRNHLERAASLEDIGCFALTELTHGSNVKGILTEAHYDHSNQEFVLHTPNNDAMKFWIGAAGNIANMSVIWAQLYINGECYGVHSYIVPLRDQKTHKLLPGVLVGDCGLKNGNNIVDNGFIILNKVRIPKSNQLDRISGVDENGKFRSSVQNQQKRFGLHLAALSGGRFMISMNCSIIAISALTIAIRFACSRRSIEIRQPLLFNQKVVRRQLMPLLAQTVVYMSGNINTLFVWDANHKNILDPKNEIIKELHAYSSATKPKTSWFTAQVIKECRQVMGPFGYSSYSKMGVLLDDNDVNLTWEGDNNVLIQQTTKYVLDNFRKIMKGKTLKDKLLQFLGNPPTEEDIKLSERDFVTSLKGIRTFLQFKISAKVQAMITHMVQLKEKKLANMDIWNHSQIFLGRDIALSAGDLFYLDIIDTQIKKLKYAPNQKVMTDCAVLWGLKLLRYDSFTNSVHHSFLESLIMEYCEILAPQSLGILECLSAGQLVIGSPFANEEGKGHDKYWELSAKNIDENQEHCQLLANRN